jgi:hypothetical protein
LAVHVQPIVDRRSCDNNKRERLMTLKLDIPQEIEAGLLAQAQALGLSLEAYAQQVLQERSRSVLPSVRAGTAEKARAFEAWARSHAHNLPLPDEALRRENLVRDAR